MKGGDALFVPSTKPDDDEEEAPESGTEEKTADTADTLLGHAFDAFQDNDRAGFIRTMKALLNSRD